MSIIKKNSDSDYAHNEAGKAAGRILKQLLLDEKRTFETRKILRESIVGMENMFYKNDNNC